MEVSFGRRTYFRRFTPTPPDGKVEDTALVPLVFVGHLVEELSMKSPFINNIGCEKSAVEGAPSHGSSGRSR